MAIDSMPPQLRTIDDDKSVLVPRDPRNDKMRVILDVLQGPRKGRSFVFDRHDTFIVGRSRFVHCPMPEDTALSRDHFLIEINPPRCEMRDLGSTNGTFVNDAAGGAGPAQLGRPDRGRAERLPGAGRGRVVAVDRRPSGGRGQVRTAIARCRRAPIRCAGCGAAAPPDVDVAGPGRDRRRRGDRVALRSPAAPRPPRCPSRSRTTPPCASWAGARWGWSTRPGTTRPGRWSR